MSFVDPYGVHDVGPAFDAAEDQRARDYVTHVLTITRLRLTALNHLAGDRTAYFNLLHRMRPVMASTPVYIESPGYVGADESELF